MKTQVFSGRWMVVILLPIFLFSCCKSSCVWEFHHTYGCAPAFHSAQVLFPRRSAIDALDIEFAKGASGLNMYLNLYFCPVDWEEGEESRCEVSYQIQGESHMCRAPVLEGGQRLIIPPDDCQRIILALLNDQSVVISLGHYQATVPSANFPYVYNKLEHF